MARQLTEAVRSVLGKATSGIVAPQNTIRAEAMRAGPVTVLTGEQAEKALFGQFSPDVPTLETVDE
jgi:hypothetical protein